MIVVAALLLAPLLACSPTDPPTENGSPAADAMAARAAASDFLLGGIQVHEATLDGWLDALQASGMNTISVTDYAHHGDWDTQNMWWEPNPDLLPEIRGAKARGMRVVLILRLALDHAFPRNKFLWHGMIMPATDDMLTEWFARYETFVRHWAEIAAREDIDVLMIGSELNALTNTQPLDARIASEQGWAQRLAHADDPAAVDAINRRRARLEQHWLALIACVRSVYDGPIGYAANFDSYQEVSFWDQLDIMGINAYFKLRHHLVPDGDEDALYRDLEAGWRAVLGEIESFRARDGLDLPILFSEMGFTPRANSTIETWADTGFSLIPTGPEPDADEQLVIWNQQPFVPMERALAVRALATQVERRGLPFEGLLYWKLSSHDYHFDDEAFLLLIGQLEEDPLLAELRRFL